MLAATWVGHVNHRNPRVPATKCLRMAGFWLCGPPHSTFIEARVSSLDFSLSLR
jgi:hypothetical protein